MSFSLSVILYLFSYSFFFPWIRKISIVFIEISHISQYFIFSSEFTPVNNLIFSKKEKRNLTLSTKHIFKFKKVRFCKI